MHTEFNKRHKGISFCGIIFGILICMSAKVLESLLAKIVLRDTIC